MKTKITDPVQLFTLGFTEQELPNSIKSNIFEDWIITEPIHWNENTREWECTVRNESHGYVDSPRVVLYLNKRFFRKNTVTASLIFGHDGTDSAGPR